MKWLKFVCQAVALFIASAPISSSRTVQPTLHSYTVSNNGEYIEIYPDHSSQVYHQHEDITTLSTQKSLHPSVLAHHYYDPPTPPSVPIQKVNISTEIWIPSRKHNDPSSKVSPSTSHKNDYIAKVTYSQSPQSVSYATTEYLDVQTSTEPLIRKMVVRRKVRRPLRLTNEIPVEENTTEHELQSNITSSKVPNVTMDLQKNNDNPPAVVNGRIRNYNREKFNQSASSFHTPLSINFRRQQKFNNQTSYQDPILVHIIPKSKTKRIRKNNTSEFLIVSTEKIRPSNEILVNTTTSPRLIRRRQKTLGEPNIQHSVPTKIEVVRPITENPQTSSTTTFTSPIKNLTHTSNKTNIIISRNVTRKQDQVMPRSRTRIPVSYESTTPEQYLLQEYNKNKNSDSPEKYNQRYPIKESYDRHPLKESNQSYDKEIVNFKSKLLVTSSTDEPNVDEFGIDAEEEIKMDDVDPDEEYPEDYWEYETGDETTINKPSIQHIEVADLNHSASDGHEHQNDEKNDSGVEGEGEKEKSAKHDENGKKAEKLFESRELYDKAKRGQSDKKDHAHHLQEEGGKKNKHLQEMIHAKGHQVEAEGKKSAEFNEVGKHKKGHSTKGSHNVHKKDEYLKKYEFYDEHHEDDAHHKYNDFDIGQKHKHGGHFSKLHNDKDLSEGEKGNRGKTEKGRYIDNNFHHEKKLGEKKHHDDAENYHKERGTKEGKKWKYEKSKDLEEENED